jgi:hypothetical protein
MKMAIAGRILACGLAVSAAVAFASPTQQPISGSSGTEARAFAASLAYLMLSPAPGTDRHGDN